MYFSITRAHQIKTLILNFLFWEINSYFYWHFLVNFIFYQLKTSNSHKNKTRKIWWKKIVDSEWLKLGIAISAEKKYFTIITLKVNISAIKTYFGVWSNFVCKHKAFEYVHLNQYYQNKNVIKFLQTQFLPIINCTL